MAGSRLEENWAEIQDMMDDGASQAEVIRHFKARGIEIPRSTLSDFVRKRQDDNIQTAVQEDEDMQLRHEAALHFQRAMMDELTDKLGDVIEGLQQLKQEGDARNTQTMQALQELTGTVALCGNMERKMDAALARLDAVASRTTGAALRWVWVKAGGIACACTTAALVATALVLGYW